MGRGESGGLGGLRKFGIRQGRKVEGASFDAAESRIFVGSPSRLSGVKVRPGGTYAPLNPIQPPRSAFLAYFYPLESAAQVFGVGFLRPFRFSPVRIRARKEGQHTERMAWPNVAVRNLDKGHRYREPAIHAVESRLGPCVDQRAAILRALNSAAPVLLTRHD